MTRLTSIITALDELLSPGDFQDLGPNGLQVPGPSEVERVVTGVSAQRALVERAVAEGAQLVLVHHGLFWDFMPTGLTPVLAERLRPLFKHDIALASYHLPLDAHPEVGNNAILAERLGCERHEPFGTYRGVPIGRAGTFPARGSRRRTCSRACARSPRACRPCSTAARSACGESGSSPAAAPTCSRRL